MSQINAIVLSENLLKKVKVGNNIQVELNLLRQISSQDLIEELKSDTAKKVFWINLYNAFIQFAGYELKENKKTFLTKKRIALADTTLSFDDVEHGILRKGKYKHSLGFFNSWFQDKTLKNLQVEQLDYRIHFALNCGAKSCPPILF